MFEFPEQRPSWTYSSQHSRFFSKLVQSPNKEADSLKILKLSYCDDSQESNSSSNDAEDDNVLSRDVEFKTNDIAKSPSGLSSLVSSISDSENDVGDHFHNEEDAEDVDTPQITVKDSNPQISDVSEISDTEMEWEEGECPPTPPPNEAIIKKCKLSQEGKLLQDSFSVLRKILIPLEYFSLKQSFYHSDVCVCVCVCVCARGNQYEEIINGS